jgi:hypothetical protein
MDADEVFFFRLGVNLRDLRASPDSVAAGRAVPLRGNFMFLPPCFYQPLSAEHAE